MRYEFKYFVSEEKLDELREMTRPFIKPDPYARGRKDNSYVVRSIYFDTPQLDFYFEKVEGIKNRKKVRIRGYNAGGENSTAFLEIKRKYDVPIRKFRAPLPFSSVKKLLCEGGELDALVQNSTHYAQAQNNANRFCYQLYRGNLKPVVLVVYEREAYLGKWDTTIRITFDKQLRSSGFPAIGELFRDEGLQPAFKDLFILEVKFNDYFPAWMKPVIGSLGLKRESASKYVISMDTHQMKRYSPQDILVFNRWETGIHSSQPGKTSGNFKRNPLI